MEVFHLIKKLLNAIKNLDMDTYCASSGAFVKHPTHPMDNYMPSSSLKNFYNNQFSSSAIMASFANNYHNHHQHHDQQQQHQQHLHHYFSSNYDASSYSSYPYSHSQFNPYTYQSLTPPPQQNDYNLNHSQCTDSLKKADLLVKSENIQQQLLGKYNT